MTQETITYIKIINEITYTKIVQTTFNSGKQIRYEVTYTPSIKFGLEVNGWNKINKKFNIIK